MSIWIILFGEPSHKKVLKNTSKVSGYVLRVYLSGCPFSVSCDRSAWP